MPFGVTNTTSDSQATCGHTLTGSTTVFVDGGGISRIDTTNPSESDRTLLAPAGLISPPSLSPGRLSVLCESKVVSVIGDAIISHTPCEAGEVSHCAAFTGGSSDVFIQ